MLRSGPPAPTRHLDAASALGPLPGLPLRLARHLVSFETALVLFLFAGAYKSNPRLAWLFPLDPTLAFLAAGALAAAWALWREGLYRPGLDMLLAYALFAAWAVVAWTWTPVRGYPTAKLGELVVLNGFCIVAGGMVVAGRHERLVRFLAIGLLVAAPLALDWLSGYGAIDAYVKQETSAHAAARVFAFGGVVAFVAFLRARPLSLPWALAGGLFALFFLALLVTGARTLLVTAVLVLLVPALVRVRLPRGRLPLHRAQLVVLASLALIGAYVAYLFAVGRVPWTLVRLSSLVLGAGLGESGGGLHVTDNQRFLFFEVALRKWLEAPLLGQGLGSFPWFAFKLDIRAYPHNIFLELLLETGILGLLLFLPTLLLPLARVRLARLRDDPAYLALLMLVVVGFFYGLGSGDIPSFAFTHALLGMLLVRRPAPDGPPDADAGHGAPPAPDDPCPWAPDPPGPPPAGWAGWPPAADDAAEAALPGGPPRSRPPGRPLTDP